MATIKTEFGIIVSLDQEILPVEATCMQYPYTVDLCLAAMTTVGKMDDVLAYRNITDPELADRIKEAASYYHVNKEPLPNLVKRFAVAHYMLDDGFPGAGLHLVHVADDNIRHSFGFSTAPIDEEPQVAIPCPAWLKGDYRKLWEGTCPRRVGIGIDHKFPVASFYMEGFGFPIRDYNLSDLIRAVDGKLATILGKQNIKGTLTIRFGKRSPGKDGHFRRKP